MLRKAQNKSTFRSTLPPTDSTDRELERTHAAMAGRVKVRGKTPDAVAKDRSEAKNEEERLPTFHHLLDWDWALQGIEHSLLPWFPPA